MQAYCHRTVDASEARDDTELLEENETVLTFEPGLLGVNVHRKTGQVFMVEEQGQGARLGVRVGMVMDRIDGFHYTARRLSRCLSGPCVFNITFKKGPDFIRESPEQLCQQAEECFSQRRARAKQIYEEQWKMQASLESLRAEVEDGERARLAILKAEAFARKEYSVAKEDAESRRQLKFCLLEAPTKSTNMMKAKLWYALQSTVGCGAATPPSLSLPPSLSRKSLADQSHHDFANVRDRVLKDRLLGSRSSHCRRYGGA